MKSKKPSQGSRKYPSIQRFFPYAFLEAFGNKDTTIKRLRAEGKASTNQSDLPGGVLQRNNIHLKVCPEGEVTATLAALRNNPATTKQKAKFILATGRLNRLYVELLRENADWSTEQRRRNMNHFMARLIFCFFAENTGIFHSTGLFTATVDQMSARDSSNTHQIIEELFRAMNTKLAERGATKIKPWANVFPYVNGGLFSGSHEGNYKWRRAVVHLDSKCRFAIGIGHDANQKANPRRGGISF